MSKKKIGKYRIEETLGEGYYAKVKRAINTETNEIVAIKMINKSRVGEMGSDAIKKEISIMRLINHPNVVKLYEVLSSGKSVHLVMEYINGGDLIDRIEKKGRMRDREANLYFKQLVAGVEHCHENGICHRDLKPENLLIDNVTQVLKISDFGLSALYDSNLTVQSNLQYTSVGTPNYVAPEMLAGKGYDGRKADIWSLGVILFVILAGQLPFDELSIQKLYQKITNASCQYPAWILPDAKDLIKKILVANPAERITIEEIKKHVWFTKYDADALSLPLMQHRSTVSTLSSLSSDSDFNQRHSDSGKELSPASITGPGLNAFELIALCSGLDHRLIFSDPAEGNLYSKFYSVNDHKSIIKAVSSALASLKIYHKIFMSSLAIKAQKSCSSQLRFDIRIISVVDRINIVKFQREKGNPKDFALVCKELYSLLGSIISGHFQSIEES